jgi:hypothetical protein
MLDIAGGILIACAALAMLSLIATGIVLKITPSDPPKPVDPLPPPKSKYRYGRAGEGVVVLND